MNSTVLASASAQKLDVERRGERQPLEVVRFRDHEGIIVLEVTVELHDLGHVWRRAGQVARVGDLDEGPAMKAVRDLQVCVVVGGVDHGEVQLRVASAT